jgi:hypothetical protein
MFIMTYYEENNNFELYKCLNRLVTKKITIVDLYECLQQSIMKKPKTA